MITKLNDREAGVRFVNYEYDYRPISDETKAHYRLIMSITISNCKCPITCKCPINALIGGLLTNQIRGNGNTYDDQEKSRRVRGRAAAWRISGFENLF